MSDQHEKYQVKWTSKFKKDYKQAKKRGCDVELLKQVVHLIARGDQQQKLIEEYDDHPLSGSWKEHRELHLEIATTGLLSYKCIHFHINDIATF